MTVDAPVETPATEDVVTPGTPGEGGSDDVTTGGPGESDSDDSESEDEVA